MKWSHIALFVVDVVAVVSIVILRSLATYEASLMTPYALGLLLFLAFLVAAFGGVSCWKHGQRRAVLIYVAHIAFLIIHFLFAELGFFRGDI